jgi:acetyl-CoA carboxylase biotin carboxyl carrier protein
MSTKNTQELRALIKVLKDEGISEIEVSDGNKTIRVAQNLSSHHIASSADKPVQSAFVEPPKEKATPAGHVIKSPMVGTFYSSASPETEPYVHIGKNVQIGDTLCIIEAMKMFNKIKADKSGCILSCHLENGQAIEYGQELFVIG